MESINTDKGLVSINGHPQECPFCHNKITPINIYATKAKSDELHAFLSCPNLSCKASFIAYYVAGFNYYTFIGKVSQGTKISKQFNSTIVDISPNFSTIYNQAYTAEQQDLKEICGVGYRKALEFLIKDYTILNNPDKKEAIEKMPLAKCISTFINDERIIKVSTRAAWLGNDETHYIRQWEGKNLEDLKKLIDLTLHWIEMEYLTNSFEEEMPNR